MLIYKENIIWENTYYHLYNPKKDREQEQLSSISKSILKASTLKFVD